MNVELLYFEGCPHVQAARELLAEVGVEAELVRVESTAEAERLGVPG